MYSLLVDIRHERVNYFLQKTVSQKSDGVHNSCYKIVVRKYPTYKLKKKKAKNFKNQLYDFPGSWKTPTHHRRELMFLKQPGSHFLPVSKPPATNLARKRHSPQCFRDIVRSAM